ncbi:MAG: PASTA domain-containing protein, partial [Actinobacteria bacterium]
VVSTGVPLVIMPGVIGKPQAEATTELISAGVTVSVMSAYDNTVTAGTVISQIPAVGDQVMPNTTAQIVVSKGKPPAAAVVVPNVTGKNKTDADKAVKKAGLSPQYYEVYDPKVSKGRVIGTLPPAGSRVAKGTTIGVFISLGKPSSTSTDTVTVPNVVGQQQITAMTSITSAGLTPIVIQQYSDGIPSGTVFNQMPAAGTRMKRGTPVGILVSLGPVPQN